MQKFQMFTDMGTILFQTKFRDCMQKTLEIRGALFENIIGQTPIVSPKRISLSLGQ